MKVLFFLVRLETLQTDGILTLMECVNLSILQSHIALIIPAYEPDDNLIRLVADIRADYQGPIIIVNDGSGSEYDAIYDTLAEDSYANVEILKHHVNMGKGRALKDAFNYVLNTYPDICGCVTADSDGQHTPTDIYRCMQELYNHPQNLIMGCRSFKRDDVPVRSKIGNNLMLFMCRYMCGIKVSDTQTGLRGIPRELCAELLNLKGERFDFETRMLLLAKDDYPFREIEIETVYESKDEHKSHYNTIKDSFRIGKIFVEAFVKFLLSSLSSSVIDLLLFNALCPIFKPITALYYVTIASVIARIISASYNYTINYKLVFNSKSKHSKSALRYLILAILQGSLSALLVTGAVWAIPMGNETIIKMVIDVVLFFISYCIQRTFVF